MTLIYHNNLKHGKSMLPLKFEKQQNCDKLKNCHICNKISNKMAAKVINHDHLTGLHNGVAQSSCNLIFKYQILFQ